MSEYSDVDQELAHKMVVEMLAHQFAYPVKWYIQCSFNPKMRADWCRIDTQDVLLQQQKTERLVEIGPSDTLTVMAKRTIKSQFEAKDAALSTKRQLLSGDSDLKEIYYDVDPEPLATPRESDDNTPPPYTLGATHPAEIVRPVAATSSQKKPDVSVSALEILLGIIAQKLKKPSAEISTSSTIKSLVSGGFFSSANLLRVY